MNVSIIVASDDEGGIGFRGALPWNIPADLAHFRRLTMGRQVIVGHETLRSMPPLPGRHLIALTRRPGYRSTIDVRWMPSLESALRAASLASADEIMIAGGSSVYAAAMPYAKRIYRTRVKGEHQADRYFAMPKESWRRVDLVTGDACDWETWRRDG